MTLLDIDAADSVSRETLQKLGHYRDMLEKWNKAINLVSAATLPDIWSRHFRDSAQIFDFVQQDQGRWVDLGSGGGFPGLVIATVAAEKRPDLAFVLIEADQRKATFLREVARELALASTIVCDRIENATPQQADIVSARALASLPVLLGMVARHLKPSGRAILMKGAAVEEEIAEAHKVWSFDVKMAVSLTSKDARILTLSHLQKVDRT